MKKYLIKTLSISGLICFLLGSLCTRNELFDIAKRAKEQGYYGNNRVAYAIINRGSNNILLKMKASSEGLETEEFNTDFNIIVDKMAVTDSGRVFAVSGVNIYYHNEGDYMSGWASNMYTLGGNINGIEAVHDTVYVTNDQLFFKYDGSWYSEDPSLADYMYGLSFNQSEETLYIAGVTAGIMSIYQVYGGAFSAYLINAYNGASEPKYIKKVGSTFYVGEYTSLLKSPFLNTIFNDYEVAAIPSGFSAAEYIVENDSYIFMAYRETGFIKLYALEGGIWVLKRELSQNDSGTVDMASYGGGIIFIAVNSAPGTGIYIYNYPADELVTVTSDPAYAVYVK